ncbi:MAG: hypothetical protein CMK78_13460 [Pseudomonadales bacterium]|nr:hypothetical protein [Pseudomonadales bacterium]
MKVTFTHKSGRQQDMHERFAIPLQKLGRGTYMTKVMRAEEVPALEVVEPVEPVEDAEPADEQEKPVKRRARKTKAEDQE